MQVSSININSNVFQGKKEEKTGGAGKAFASIIPGLGQFLDGRNKEGAFFMGGFMGLGVINYFINKDYYLEVFKAGKNAEKIKSAYTKFLESKRSFASYLCVAAASALWIINIADAYRGNKSKILDTFVKNDDSEKPKVYHKVKKATTEKTTKSGSSDKDE